MKYLRGRERYEECNRHIIQLVGENLKTKELIFGCLNCGARYDSVEEIRKDIGKIMGTKRLQKIF